MSKSKYAGALLITPDYKIIFQQRDNRPGIINPGQITTFGGAVEPVKHQSKPSCGS